jgi:hypothetical protein
MKKFICSILVLILITVSWAQQPIKQQLLPMLNYLPELPKELQIAYNECQPECKVQTTVLKPYKDKISVFQNVLKNMNPGNIDMSAYMNPGSTTPPTPAEIQMMQLMGTVGNAIQELIPYQENLAKLNNDFNNKITELLLNTMDEINRCPQDKNSNSENPPPDPACVKSIIEKMIKLRNELFEEYIKSIQPVLQEYRMSVENKYNDFEVLFPQMDYGDKANMKSMKVLVFNIQGNLFAAMEAYAQEVGSIWSKCCDFYSETEKIKNGIYK